MSEVKPLPEKPNSVTNPAGREGKPLSLAPLTTEQALRKLLAVKPEKLAELKNGTKKPAKVSNKKS